MKQPEDYYNILGVRENALPEEIKKAYRELVKVYHPDKGITVRSEEFIAVTKAYEVLSDSAERTKYDQKRAFWKRRYGTASEPQPGMNSVKYTDDKSGTDAFIFNKSPLYYNTVFVVGLFAGAGLIFCGLQFFWLKGIGRFFLLLCFIPGYILLRDGYRGLRTDKKQIISGWMRRIRKFFTIDFN